MNPDIVKIQLKINRFDLDDEPITEEKIVELFKSSDYCAVKFAIQEACNIGDIDGKVIKIRNQDGALIPPTYMLDDNNCSNTYIVDIAKITCNSTTRPTVVQDVYLNAIRKNLTGMENRVSQAEKLIPQLQWRRQTHMEQTVNSLSTKVAFLNKRIDELTPTQWKTKMPQTAA